MSSQCHWLINFSVEVSAASCVLCSARYTAKEQQKHSSWIAEFAEVDTELARNGILEVVRKHSRVRASKQSPSSVHVPSFIFWSVLNHSRIYFLQSSVVCWSDSFCLARNSNLSKENDEFASSSWNSLFTHSRSHSEFLFTCTLSLFNAPRTPATTLRKTTRNKERLIFYQQKNRNQPCFFFDWYPLPPTQYRSVHVMFEKKEV